MGFMVVSTLCVTGTSTIVRYLSADLHPFEIGFFRVFVGFLVLSAVFVRSGLQPLRTRRIGLHALRGALQVFSLLASFYALSLIPLAQWTALSFTSPLFAALLAVLILGEVVGPRRTLGLLFGFAGAMVIVRPGLAHVNPGVMLAVASTLVWGGVLVVIKALARTESSMTMTLYTTIFVTPFALAATIPVWTWPGWDQLVWLVMLGAIGSLRHLSIAQAFKEADATAILPLDFTKLIWAAIVGYIVFAEVPDLSAILLTAKVDEEDRGRLRTGQTATVRVDALPSQVFQAIVEDISVLARVDFSAGWPAVRNFDLRVRLDSGGAELRPGMSATARLEVDRLDDVLKIPAQAVFIAGGRPVAYRLVGSRFEPTPIDISKRTGDEVAVSAGLADGDRVATVEPPIAMIAER